MDLRQNVQGKGFERLSRLLHRHSRDDIGNRLIYLESVFLDQLRSSGFQECVQSWEKVREVLYARVE